MTKYVLPISHDGSLHGTLYNYYTEIIPSPAIIFFNNAITYYDEITYGDPSSSDYGKAFPVYNSGKVVPYGSLTAVVYLDLFFKRKTGNTVDIFTYENTFFKYESGQAHWLDISYQHICTFGYGTPSFNSARQIHHVYSGAYLTLKSDHTLVWEDCSTDSSAGDLEIKYDNGSSEIYPSKVKLNQRFVIRRAGNTNNTLDKPPKKILKYIVFTT
jgi:hypothetical protein